MLVIGSNVSKDSCTILNYEPKSMIKSMSSISPNSTMKYPFALARMKEFFLSPVSNNLRSKHEDELAKDEDHSNKILSHWNHKRFLDLKYHSQQEWIKLQSTTLEKEWKSKDE